MPVLDAKALDIDSKGMAFLKSVLRAPCSSEVTPKKVPRIAKVRLHMLKRSREFSVGTA
jgi:hypothetical protein